MGIPEAIAIFSSASIALNNVKRKNLIYMILTYLLVIYFLKNTLPLGISSLFLYISIAIILHIFSKVKIERCFILTAIILGIKILTEVMTVTLINFMGINLQSILDNSTLKNLSCYVSLLFMFIIMKLVKYRYFIKRLDLRNISIKNKYTQQVLFYISILIMAITGILILLIYSLSEMHYNIEILMRIFVALSFIFILIALIITLINYDKRKVLNELEKNLMEKSLKQMEDSVDALRVQRHDYMNHLQIILMQMSTGKIEDAKRYILGMADYDSDVDIDFITGNHFLDAILNTKKLRASRYDIDLTACIDSLLDDIELSDSEMSSILLNIIDNAIDELKTYEKDYKYVHIDIYKCEYYHNISIKNNGSKIIDTKKIFELGYSSKDEGRGYGLYSIKKLLESYKCMIEVDSDDLETEFYIQIPINKK
ncbi:Sensor histidine kinase DcuS [uncultured Clostridium sp.]|nr:Sensor histidine kinase DcuS [uncultured Clostridium sp.]SCI93158.1 Sensor histidine kinase DcuS [uncultured Clostridium sp.]